MRKEQAGGGSGMIWLVVADLEADGDLGPGPGQILQVQVSSKALK